MRYIKPFDITGDESFARSNEGVQLLCFAYIWPYLKYILKYNICTLMLGFTSTLLHVAANVKIVS